MADGKLSVEQTYMYTCNIIHNEQGKTNRNDDPKLFVTDLVLDSYRIWIRIQARISKKFDAVIPSSFLALV
jgi:hypothetical protein